MKALKNHPRCPSCSKDLKMIDIFPNESSENFLSVLFRIYFCQSFCSLDCLIGQFKSKDDQVRDLVNKYFLNFHV